MRVATLALAMAGLLLVGPKFAVGEDRPDRMPMTTNAVASGSDVVITPVHRYVYRPAPGWYGYYRSTPYTVYRGDYYRPRPPRYYNYDVYPNPGYYYYPNGFEFEYHGPRRSFSFGF